MNYKKVLAGLLVAVGSVVLIGGGAMASSAFRAGDATTIAPGEVVDSTVFLAGESINIAGEVNGDVYCAAQTLTITGVVRGDVLCGAQTVRIAGTVEGDVRVAGQTVTFGGDIEQSATVAAQVFTHEQSATIGRDLSLGANSATIDGQVVRDIFASSSTLAINGLIGRDVVSDTVRVSVGSSARVAGDVEYSSVNEIEVSQGGQVVGNTERLSSERESENQDTVSAYLGASLYLIVSLFIVSMVIALLAPRTLHIVSRQGLERIGWAALAGVITLIVVPVISIFLLITIIGIPLGIILVTSAVLLVLVSGPFAAYYFGRLLQPNLTNALAIMAVGSIALLVLYVIPIIGGFVMIASAIIGSGMIVNEVIRRLKNPNYKVAHDTGSKKSSKKA